MCWERSRPGPPLESPRVSSPSVSHPTSAWASLPSSSPPSLLPSRLPGRTAASRTFVLTSFQAPQSASAKISAKRLKYLKYFYQFNPDRLTWPGGPGDFSLRLSFLWEPLWDRALAPAWLITAIISKQQYKPCQPCNRLMDFPIHKSFQIFNLRLRKGE